VKAEYRFEVYVPAIDHTIRFSSKAISNYGVED